MPVRKLVPALLKAGTRLRDKAIEMTGTPAYVKNPTEVVRGRYGVQKVAKYQSPVRIYLLIDWTEQRLAFDIMDVSEEEDPVLEAQARMCDDIQEGAEVEFDIVTDAQITTTQFYKVNAVNVQVKENYYSKKISLIPERTEVQ